MVQKETEEKARLDGFEIFEDETPRKDLQAEEPKKAFITVKRGNSSDGAKVGTLITFNSTTAKLLGIDKDSHVMLARMKEEGYLIAKVPDKSDPKYERLAIKLGASTHGHLRMSMGRKRMKMMQGLFDFYKLGPGDVHRIEVTPAIVGNLMGANWNLLSTTSVQSEYSDHMIKKLKERKDGSSST